MGWKQTHLSGFYSLITVSEINSRHYFMEFYKKKATDEQKVILRKKLRERHGEF